MLALVAKCLGILSLYLPSADPPLRHLMSPLGKDETGHASLVVFSPILLTITSRVRFPMGSSRLTGYEPIIPFFPITNSFSSRGSLGILSLYLPSADSPLRHLMSPLGKDETCHASLVVSSPILLTITSRVRFPMGSSRLTMCHDAGANLQASVSCGISLRGGPLRLAKVASYALINFLHVLKTCGELLGNLWIFLHQKTSSTGL